MNLDPAPPVRPLLTHVIADEPLRREAGINNDGAGKPAGLPTQRRETVATASPSVSQRPYSRFAWLRCSSLLKFYNLDIVNTKTLI